MDEDKYRKLMSTSMDRLAREQRRRIEHFVIADRLADDLAEGINVYGKYKRALRGYTKALSETQGLSERAARTKILRCYRENLDETPKETLAKVAHRDTAYCLPDLSVRAHQAHGKILCDLTLDEHRQIEAYRQLEDRHEAVYEQVQAGDLASDHERMPMPEPSYAFKYDNVLVQQTDRLAWLSIDAYNLTAKLCEHHKFDNRQAYFLSLTVTAELEKGRSVRAVAQAAKDLAAWWDWKNEHRQKEMYRDHDLSPCMDGP